MTTQHCERVLFCSTCQQKTTQRFIGGSDEATTKKRVPVFRCPVCKKEAQYVHEEMPDVKEYKES